METRLHEILSAKGTEVHTAQPDDRVLDAVHTMNLHSVGAVVVLRGERIAGIFTERDVLRRLVGAKRDALTTRVHEVMTAPVFTIGPDARLSQTLALCSDMKSRHLPVVDDSRLAGIVSVGDLTRHLLDEYRGQMHDLNDLIWGPHRIDPALSARARRR